MGRQLLTRGRYQIQYPAQGPGLYVSQPAPQAAEPPGVPSYYANAPPGEHLHFLFFSPFMFATVCRKLILHVPPPGYDASEMPPQVANNPPAGLSTFHLWSADAVVSRCAARFKTWSPLPRSPRPTPACTRRCQRTRSRESIRSASTPRSRLPTSTPPSPSLSSREHRGPSRERAGLCHGGVGALQPEGFRLSGHLSISMSFASVRELPGACRNVGLKT